MQKPPPRCAAAPAMGHGKISALDYEGDARNDSRSRGDEGKRQHRYERSRQGDFASSGMDSQGQQTRAVRIWAELPHRIIDVEATRACTCDEVAATQTMLDRGEERLDLRPCGSQRTRPMGWASSSAGWSRRSKLSRTSRYGRRSGGWHSPVRTSTGLVSAGPTSAQRETALDHRRKRNARD
jgi:hypothetical protein